MKIQKFKLLRVLFLVSVFTHPFIGFGATEKSILSITAGRYEDETSNLPDSVKRDKVVALSQGMIPYLSLSDFRKGAANGAKVIYIQEGTKSGMFLQDDSKEPLADDSSMVLVNGGIRYKREDLGYIRPEWFGANPLDNNDDGSALQKTLNKATINGLDVVLSPGIYYTSVGLSLKALTQNGRIVYKITISGVGEGRSSIKGMKGIEGQDLLFMNPGNIKDAVNYVTIKNLALLANGANRCFWASAAGFIKFENVMFHGGEDVCVKIGTYGKSECYGIYFSRCYFNGATVNGGQNNTLLQLHQTRMAVVNEMESDGGKYSIDLYGSDKATIVNSKLEGAKGAGIIIRGAYGGEHKIANNLINAYVSNGGDANNQYDGSLSGIELAGGGYNTISNNQILIPNSQKSLGLFNISKVNKSPVSSPTKLVTGQGGGKAKLLGFNKDKNTVYITATDGAFKPGETVTQAETGASFVLGESIGSSSYGIKISNGAYSVITGNTIRLSPDYGIFSNSDGVIFNSNFVEASKWGIYTTRPMVISGNQLSVPKAVSIERGPNTDVMTAGNRIMSGDVVNFSEKTAGDGSKPSSSNNKNALNTASSPDIPVYTDNAAAAKGGLASGAIYRTPTGELRVKY